MTLVAPLQGFCIVATEPSGGNTIGAACAVAGARGSALGAVAAASVRCCSELEPVEGLVRDDAPVTAAAAPMDICERSLGHSDARRTCETANKALISFRTLQRCHRRGSSAPSGWDWLRTARQNPVQPAGAALRTPGACMTGPGAGRWAGSKRLLWEALHQQRQYQLAASS